MTMRNYQPVGQPFRPGARFPNSPSRPGGADTAFPELAALTGIDPSLNPGANVDRRVQEIGIQNSARDITQRDLAGGGINIPGAPTDFSVLPRIDTSALQSFVDRAPPPMPGKPARPELFAAADRIGPLELVGRAGPGPMPSLKRQTQLNRPPPRRM